MEYPYVPFPERGRLSWPDGKRLAVIMTINLETWDLLKDRTDPYYAGGPPILPDVLAGNVPDFPNYTWREYGQRVGVWRMFRLFEELGVKPSCTLNAVTIERRSQMVDFAEAHGYELVAHNYEQGELLTDFHADPEREAEVIRATLDVYEKHLGRRSKGWLSSSLRGTLRTADVLAAEGCTFYCDLLNDDQPYLVQTPNGPIVAVPYSNEINDFTLLTRRGYTTEQYRDTLIEELDTLYAESASTGLLMNVGLHPHVSGRAYRMRALREFVEHAKSLDGVWFARRDEIADWYLEHHAEHIAR